jgi:hypothetical protein
MTFNREWERREVGEYRPGISRQVANIERK